MDEANDAEDLNNVQDLTESNEPIPESEEEKPQPKKINMSPGAVQLRSWLNKSFRVEMVDGRVLIGVFLCTDRDANVILGSCTEYLPADENVSDNSTVEEPRMLGLVMIPGKHIVSVSLDQSQYGVNESDLSTPLSQDLDSVEIT